jgi:hypothetical protein
MAAGHQVPIESERENVVSEKSLLGKRALVTGGARGIGVKTAGAAARVRG